LPSCSRNVELRRNLTERLQSAGVSSIEVDRPATNCAVTIRTSRPGIIIGRKGAEIEKLKQELAKKTHREFSSTFRKCRRPSSTRSSSPNRSPCNSRKARRFPARHAQGGRYGDAVRHRPVRLQGHQGAVSGRLNGAEIARSEWYCKASSFR